MEKEITKKTEPNNKGLLNLYSLISPNNIFVRVFFHVIFWITYLTVHTLLMMMNVSDKSFFDFAYYTVVYFMWVDVLATYFTLYVLMPLLLYKGKYVQFIIYFSLSAIFFVLITQISNYFFYIPNIKPEWAFKQNFWNFPYFYFIVATYGIVVLAGAIKLTRRWFEMKELQSIMEKQHLKSELDMLKMQVSPHFLFNTLNNIDSLIYKDQDKASETIIKLSSLMRYMLYEASTNKVDVEDEIEYLKNLVELQSLRLIKSDFINFEINGAVNKQQISPLLFVPFIENAIKHGDKTIDAPGIIIKLNIEADSLHFYIENTINKNQQKDEVGGIGLKNVERRLELLYKNKYNLNIETKETKYIVSLNIEL